MSTQKLCAKMKQERNHRNYKNTQLTCTTRTRLSGYFSNIDKKASTGKRRTVETSAARADTVL